MKKITLTQNEYALVDDEDYDVFSKFKWCAVCIGKSGNTYAVRRVSTGKVGKGRQKTLSLHREIMNPPKEFQVDHINRDGLDNRRANLRVATRSQNQANRKIGVNNTCGYKGVTRPKNGKKWVAQIGVKGELKYLGRFETPEDAHKAYCEASLKYKGEFARFN